jgi:hypothetical protein
MKTIISVVTAWLAVGAGATPVLAQAPRLPVPPTTTAALQDRYQIGLMEGILRSAAEHGAKVTRDRARTVIPGDMLLSDEVRVRGFRLDGYGVFFDIDMPDLEETTSWVYRILDQNNLGLDSAIRDLRALAEKAGDANDRQAVQRLEMQLSAGAASQGGGSPLPGRTSAQSLTGSAASTNPRTAPVSPVDPILNDPQGVYRAEVGEALIDAILDHSSGLRLELTDLFTVAIRGKEGAVRVSAADTESPTIQISVRGEDLRALLARQITREEARKRVTIKVF